MRYDSLKPNTKLVSSILMIRGAAMNAECNLVKQEGLGDHVMFIGGVTEISADENVKPLVYHNGKYCLLSIR
jgi:flavin reductase (DIM6/NTAB) family NADH-FMN oxidoreductase RutF